MKQLYRILYICANDVGINDYDSQMTEFGPIGKQIALVLTEKGFSKMAIARELGVSRSTFYNRLREDSFSESELLQMAKTLGVSKDDLKYGKVRAETIPEGALRLIQDALIEIERGLINANLTIDPEKKAEILETCVRHGIRDGRVDPAAVSRLIKLVQ